MPGSKNCFQHGPVSQNSGSSSSASAQREMRGEEGIASGSLEQLEMELHDLLRGRNAPLPLSYLPQLYHRRFGKSLQADGYLTESQRHGQGGDGLKKLLSHMKKTVTLIDGPKGQGAVVLAEDAIERDALHMIYLTFKAESSFTEEDVKSHFSAKYGPVEKVSIFREVGSFAFVTFVSSETVKTILSKRALDNTVCGVQYICYQRVFVKPYREKPDGKGAVVLKEDAPTFTAYRSEREDLSGENLSSRKIYLTFAAESLLTEEDVKSYFSTKYDLVQEVRIPHWRVRYCGFVTFVSSETVKSILSERNGHYICGARVFVERRRNFKK